MRPRLLPLAGLLATSAVLAAQAPTAAPGGKKAKKLAKELSKVDVTPEARGKPPGFEPGRPAHFWVWFGDGQWHLRTTTDKKTHRFQGTIEAAGGVFTRLHIPKAEGLGPNSDKIALNNARTAIAFDFTTDGQVDGVSFDVGPAVTALGFTLAIDGQPQPLRITIGKGGDHPPAAKFVLPAHPGKGK